MKTMSRNLKVLMVVAICAGMLVPAAASAAWNSWINGGQSCTNGILVCKYINVGDYSEKVTLPWNWRRSLNFELRNGQDGKNMVSSVRIVISDLDGNEVAVPISPDQFNQKEFSNARGYIGEEQVSKLNGRKFKMDIKVRGPKKGKIYLEID
ncbi:MAG: hypothetical protein JSV70_00610 [bacterium]|nr:MAG: hypothetical protein JSV70_00610 [bacterium]